ncbi:hypothetical protein SAMN05216319_0596 [Duganella sp. CF402]|uniref:hypothetical protein n=1 Tax=unclassified Duganella TaxID=2636909 RepID=UPI0008B10AD5|nr:MULTISPECIES: hypothetical protein [unclassified Duganella]RZT10936.1 hypothetical protein EV582_3029 [Duganella sp. BK701]SEK89240.1 hypothetical protein SAMN05216319_0596 [Duganella sp. CF402]
MRKILSGLLLACAAAAGHADPTDDWAAVDDRQLEQACGGFDLGNGMLVSLGVERLVSINGTVVASTHFSIPDMTQLSAADALTASDTMAAVLVQNSLNDQAIRTQTTINTTVANLALLKAVNFESSLRNALSGAVGK